MPTPITGQAVATGLGNPIPLSTKQITCAAFTIYAPVGNSAVVYIGPSNVTQTTGYAIDPGGQFTYTRNTQQSDSRYELEPSDLFMCGTSSDRLTWLASP